MTRALQLVDIACFGDAFSVLGQTMAKDVGHEDNVHFLADGTDRL